MLFPFDVLAVIVAAVWPLLLAFALLLVFEPASFIGCTFCIEVFTSPVSFVLVPFTLVDISVCQNEATVALGLVVLPESFILATIRPDLNTVSELLTGDRVDGARVVLSFVQGLTVYKLKFHLVFPDDSLLVLVELQAPEILLF